MMALKTTDGELLSWGLRNVSPLMIESILLENKLLDGSNHVQTIGEGLKYFQLEILCNENNVDIVTLTQSQGGFFRLELDDKYYIGYISRPDWERETGREKVKEKRIYASDIKFTITEEGSI